MKRLVSGYVDAINCALEVIPARILARVEHVHFLCGVEPVYAGLHDYRNFDTIVLNGEELHRSYATTAHFVNATNHQERTLHPSERWPTIVIPTVAGALPWPVLHELGHALDDALGYPLDDIAPVTAYAATDQYEAFAEAWCSWLADWYGDKLLRAIDPRAAAFFDALAYGVG